MIITILAIIGAMTVLPYILSILWTLLFAGIAGAGYFFSGEYARDRAEARRNAQEDELRRQEDARRRQAEAWAREEENRRYGFDDDLSNDGRAGYSNKPNPSSSYDAQAKKWTEEEAKAGKNQQILLLPKK